MNDSEFKEKLNVTQYKVMREKMFEPPYLGRYHDHFEHGMYACAACSNPLFLSVSKFDAKNGWPSFRSTFQEDSVTLNKNAEGKTAVNCGDCNSNLGFFIEGDKPYFQINSIALSFIKAPELKKEEDKGEKDEKNNETKERKETPAKQAQAAGMGLGALAATGAAGLVIGAGGGWYAAPQEMCVAPADPLIETTQRLETAPAPTPTPSPSPSAGGTVRQSPAASTPTPTPVVQTSSQLSATSSATGTPDPSSDADGTSTGTI